MSSDVPGVEPPAPAPVRDTAPPGPGRAEPDAASAPQAGRPSAVQPSIRLERRVSLLFGLIFYGFLFAAGWVWMEATGQDALALWRPRNLALEIAVGLGAGLLVVAATPLVVGGLSAARDLEREFGWILGEQRAWECVLLAVLSAASEELFFRGAATAALGPLLSLILFGALHWPVNAHFRAWPVFALLVGALLTAERSWTGTLIAPALTHAVVNAVNLVRLTRKYRIWNE